MASYSSPSTEEILALTGINTGIEDLTGTELAERLAEVRPWAETKTALSVSASIFSSTSLTAYEASALEASVALRTAAFYLRAAATRKVTGTHEPTLQEEAEAMRAQADAFEEQAEAYERYAQGLQEETDTPFARPSVSSSTFVLTDLDRLPSERLQLMDEREDLSSADLVGG